MKAPGFAGGWLLRQDEKNPSAADVTFDSWDEFQRWIKERRQSESGLIYRGHESNELRLETSFHRIGRRDINRYLNNEIPQLYRALAPMLNQRFELEKQDDFTSFLYLARHHGFPTPLLDWTNRITLLPFLPSTKASYPLTGRNMFEFLTSISARGASRRDRSR